MLRKFKKRSKKGLERAGSFSNLGLVGPKLEKLTLAEDLFLNNLTGKGVSTGKTAGCPRDILDASALMCFLKKEKGYQELANLFQDSLKKGVSVFITQINLIEVMYLLIKKSGIDKTKKILVNFQSPFFGVINYMESDLGFYTSIIKATYDVSLGDAVGLAYCKIFGATFWTADAELQKISQQENISLVMIR